MEQATIARRAAGKAGGTPAGKRALHVALAVVIILVPLIFQATTGLGFLVRILVIVGIWVLLALGLNIVVGYAGLLDLGYVAFYAMGAYAGVLIGQSVSDFLGAPPTG